MSKHEVERPRHSVEVQGVDEQCRRFDLPPPVRAEKAAELRLMRAPSPCRLILKASKRFQLTFRVDDTFHGSRTQGADQLVLQVCDADVETESFHVGACEIGAETGPFQTTLEVALLCGVTEAGESNVRAPRAESLEEGPDVFRTSHRHNGDALPIKVQAAARSERFERQLIADPFNQYNRDCQDA